MEIIVFTKVFGEGTWKNVEHKCTDGEIESVIDSAQAKATESRHFGAPVPLHYLQATHYMFDVARGSPEKPADGDTLVYGVAIDGILIGALMEFYPNRRIA